MMIDTLKINEQCFLLGWGGGGLKNILKILFLLLPIKLCSSRDNFISTVV